MSQHQLVFRLSQTDVGDGELSLEALGRLAGSLQELATRVGRLAAGRAGPGRSPSAVEAASELTLVGLSRGSTTLTIAYGARDTLPVDDGLEATIQRKYEEILIGAASGAVPTWATPGAKESVVRVLDALAYAAKTVEMTVSGHQPVRFTPATVQREPWLTNEQATDKDISMIGRVEALDLRDGRFRLRDAVGNAIVLRNVVDPDDAALLAGRQATASGRAIIDDEGRVAGIDHPTLAPAPPLPASWLQPNVADHDGIISSAPGPDPDALQGFDTAEVEEFLAALRGM